MLENFSLSHTEQGDIFTVKLSFAKYRILISDIKGVQDKSWSPDERYVSKASTMASNVLDGDIDGRSGTHPTYINRLLKNI